MTAIDRTPAGQKHVLPSAEPASDAAMGRLAAPRTHHYGRACRNGRAISVYSRMKPRRWT
jgi:hypothetical protein